MPDDKQDTTPHVYVYPDAAGASADAQQGDDTQDQEG